MKFGPKGLWLTWPIWTPFRRYLPVLGRGGTLHLQETALVIEGDLIRFKLPVLDLFVKPAFAERTLVTIPYSRIVRLRYARYVTVKVLWWLLAGALFALYARALWDPLDPGWSLYCLLLLGLLFLLLGFVVHRFFRPRHALWFRGADDKPRLVCFCLTSAERRRQFAELLRANRDAARTLTVPGATREAVR
jgi:hypothetical protein